MTDVDEMLTKVGLMHGGDLTTWIDDRIDHLMQRYMTDLDQTEATQVPRLCQQIRDRAADEWKNAKTGEPLTTDKPN
eukprot:9629301-Lingulodinium_polyedra.AAC.1